MEKHIMLMHVRKVNSVFAVLLIIMLCIMIVPVFVNKTYELIPICFVNILIISAIFLSSKKKKFEIGIAYMQCIMGCLAVLFSTPIDLIYMVIIAVLLSCLYLNIALCISNSIVINIGAILRLTLFHKLDPYNMQMIVFINLICLILYFITKWGRDIIKSIVIERQRANDLVDNLRKTMNIIDGNTKSLDKDVGNCFNNLESVRECTFIVSKTAEDVSTGGSDQSESINQICQMMLDTDEKIIRTFETSKKLWQVSEDAKSIVFEGSERICLMGKQIDTINNAVEESIITVNELNKDMSEIDKFLSSISQIAGRTKLLAINATIEAAKAGIMSKGFTVVAEEIRKLAVQTTNTARQISVITNQIKERTYNVLDKVSQGKIAVNEGKLISIQLTEAFRKVNQSFTDISDHISDELNMIKTTSSVFSKVRDETQVIAGISQDQAALSEKMLSITQEQSASIENLYILIHDIKDSSNELAGIVK